MTSVCRSYQTHLTPRTMIGDVIALARLLRTFPQDMRESVAITVIDRAKVANQHRKVYGGCHEFGGGSIMSAANRFGVDLPPEPGFDDRDYIACWQVALAAVDRLLEVEETLGMAAPSAAPADALEAAE